MKFYLEKISQHSDDIGDPQRLGELLVSLTITCRRLNNSLEQGMVRILRWVFTLPRRVITKQQLIRTFMAELRRRMDLWEVDPITVSQLGLFITGELIKNRGRDEPASTEEV